MEEKGQRDGFQELEGETVEEKEEVAEEASREVSQESSQKVEDQGGGEPMEDTVETQREEEKKEKNGKGLVYLALAFGIVALILSFWNMGLHQVVGVLKHQGEVIEHKQKVLENRVGKLQAQALLSKFQSEAQNVYTLTMWGGNYEAAAKVVTSMEGQLSALKSYYPAADVQEMAALLKALKAEVAKGPSPIPALVFKIQLLADKLSEGKVSAPAPKAVSKPEAQSQPQKVSPAEKGPVVKKAPKPEKATEGQGVLAPGKKGVLWDVLRFFDELGGKIVGK